MIDRLDPSLARNAKAAFSSRKVPFGLSFVQPRDTYSPVALGDQQVDACIERVAELTGFNVNEILRMKNCA
jgi:hypothetical protein